MMILVRKSDSVVIHAHTSILLLEDRAESVDWVDFNFNTDNADIYEAELPSLWVGGVWSFTNGSWGIYDLDRYGSIVELDRKSKIPQILTPKQARLALLGAGLYDVVNLAVKANASHEIYWEYALEVKRDDALLIELSTALGMTSQQLDDLFLAGSLL